jgi:tetratricopeptide (TPR) repeat protein
MHSEARKFYDNGLEIARALVDMDPTDTESQRNLSISYNKLGDACAGQGQFSEAQKFFGDALATAHRLADDDPTNADAQRDVMVNHYKLGKISAASENYSDAIDEYEAAVRVLERMIAAKMLVEPSKNEINLLKQEIARCDAFQKRRLRP